MILDAGHGTDRQLFINHHLARSIAMSVREADSLSPFYGDKLRGEAASLREAEASQPRDCRGTDMPDDYHPPMPRRNPEDIDLGAIKTDLEFLIERGERFRNEQALKPLYTIVGSAGIVVAWIELFWWHCL
jgi:hypothetical protein